jgi:type I restriction enzyme R subunit
MWMTGFDVPSCSTIYLDKPMRNHTLMQTIARANRVFREKVNGLIVDYIGVFRNLEKALAIYGTGAGGKTKTGESPVQDKTKLVATLRASVKATSEFCTECGASLDGIQAASGFQKVKLLDDAVEAIVVTDDSKRRYLSMAADVLRLYKAILPDEAANEFVSVQATIAVIAEKIRLLTPDPDISGVMDSVEKLLDDSVAAQAYVIRESLEEDKKQLIDLSKVDFETLKAKFDKGRKHIEAERLRAAIEKRLKTLLQKNRSRLNFMQKFQQLIDEYNAGAVNIDLFFSCLVEFTKELKEGEKRAISEALNEEELAFFDILMKPAIGLTQKERNQVKKAARELLQTLKTQKLVLDWRSRQQSRAEVRVAIENILNDELPEKFSTEMFNDKCELVYTHVYDSYFGEGKSVYTTLVA